MAQRPGKQGLLLIFSFEEVHTADVAKSTKRKSERWLNDRKQRSTESFQNIHVRQSFARSMQAASIAAIVSEQH